MLNTCFIREIEQVHRHCWHCCLGILVVYAVALLSVCAISQLKVREKEEPSEAALKCVLLAGYIFLKRPAARSKQPSTQGTQGDKDLSSIRMGDGIKKLCITILAIALVTNGFIALVPVTRQSQENIFLSLEKLMIIFIMSFMLEILDAPIPRSRWTNCRPLVYACLQVLPFMLKFFLREQEVVTMASFAFAMLRLVFKYVLANRARTILALHRHTGSTTPNPQNVTSGWNLETAKKIELDSEVGRLQRLLSTVDAQDYAKRAILSVSLHTSMTFLSTLYFLSDRTRGVLFIAPVQTHSHLWPKLIEASVEVFIIIAFADHVLDAERTLFNVSYRATRYGEVLHSLLGSVWASCSDVFIMSWTDRDSKTKSTREIAILSPSAFYLLLGQNVGSLAAYHKKNALKHSSGSTFANGRNTFASIIPDHICYSVQRHEVSSVSSGSQSKMIEVHPPGQELQSAFTKSGLEKLLDYAHRCEAIKKAETVPKTNSSGIHTLSPDLPLPPISTIRIHEILQPDGNRVHCETSISSLGHNCQLLVLRNISDRLKQVEIEKSVLVEATARRCDIETNQFIRHEIKNGVLSALGFCELALEETNEALKWHNTHTSQRQHTLSQQQSANSALRTSDSEALAETNTNGLASRHSTSDDGYLSCHMPSAKTTLIKDDIVGISDRDSTFAHPPRVSPSANASSIVHYVRGAAESLRETLHVVLQEALTRDLIHGSYTPKREQVFLPHIYAAAAAQSRYRAEVDPISITSDTQLLRLIHSNAVSNAVKFGRSGGRISVSARYHTASSRLTVHVRNEPAPRDRALLQLSADDIRARIFPRSVRLHAASDNGGTVSGGWIMNRCSQILGGFCDIEFSEDATVFSLSVPAVISSQSHMAQCFSDSKPHVATADTLHELNDNDHKNGIKRKRAIASDDSTRQAKEQRTTSAGYSLMQPSLSSVSTKRLMSGARSMSLDGEKSHCIRNVPDIEMLSAAETEYTATDVRLIPSDRAAAPCGNVDKLLSQRGKQCTTVWGIGLDDTALQRLMIKRIFGALDIPNDKAFVHGATERECLDFGDLIVRHALQYPDDAHIVIADENLDVISLGGTRSRISGSIILERARAELKRLRCPARVLMLIRSANDAPEDIAIYMRRCHGVLSKAPFSRGDIPKLILPIWNSHFTALN